MDLQLNGKRAIVTGGSRGIGKKIARDLADEGVDLVIVARGREALEATAAEITAATGRKVIPLVADMSDDQSVDAMVAAAVAALGGVDILINSAATPGGSKTATVQDIKMPALFADIDVKLGGYIRAARAVAPHMVANGWGRIISIGGLAARISGNYNSGIRSATISAFAKNLADELGPKGITSLAIHPGAMRTEQMDAATEAKFAAASSNGKLFDSSAIAWLVTVLASPKSIALNGETLLAGGGMKGIINY